jgi:hypothetical protein
MFAEPTAAYGTRGHKSGLSATSNEAAENGTAERNDNPPYPALAEILAELNDGERSRTN